MPITKVALVIQAMKLIIYWHNMQVYCRKRDSCIGCRYYSKRQPVCDEATTEDIFRIAATVFLDFLKSE